MTGPFAVLDAFALSASVGLSFIDTPETKNYIVLDPTATTSAPVQEGTLGYTQGGLPFDGGGGRARRIVVPGPGATLMGIARGLLPLFNSAAPRTTSGGPLTDFELARGLLAYNKALLGYAGPPTTILTPRWLPNWNAGVYLTLPMELDTAGGAWITNFENIRQQWGAGLAEADNFALANDALPLPIPDPNTLATTVAATLTGATATTIANTLQNDLLANPFEALFRIVETLRQLREGGPGGAAARPADVVKVISQPFELSVTLPIVQAVGLTTAGNAVLRQFQLAMEDATLVAAAGLSATDEQRVRSRLAGGLGLVSITATTWQPMGDWGPTVVPQELPLTKAQRVRSDASGTFLQEMALGRSVDISTAAGGIVNKDTHRESLTYRGDHAHRPVDWLAANGVANNIVRDLTPAQVPATVPTLVIDQARVGERVRIASRIADNEGGLDSCQAGDKGIVSFGMQQWAAHNDQELTVLFERFRVQAPDHYDLFFGMRGLQTARWDSSGGAADPGSAKKDAANPYGPDPAGKTKADLIHYFPLFATFLNVAPGAQPVVLTPPKTLGGASPRNAYFGDSKNARAWSARSRLAALLSVDFARVQFHQSAWRFTRIHHECAVGAGSAVKFDPTRTQTYNVPLRGDPARTGTQAFEYPELFSSDIAAGALLDYHINKPSGVLSAIPQSINRTPDDTIVADGTGKTFDAVWIRRFAINFIAQRSLPPDNARARAWGLVRLHDLATATPPQPDRALSPDPGTFTGW